VKSSFALNHRGYTFVEILVTSALIIVVIFSVTTSLRMSQNFLSQVRGKRNRDRVVGSTLQNVVENISLFQKNFNVSKDWSDTLLDPQVLPLAWDQNVLTTKAECPSCPGRMGFIIQPLEGSPGLNKLTVRITHQTLIQGFQDYVYVLSDD
jgi:type II secretory pathway pseudopilin PulG